MKKFTNRKAVLAGSTLIAAGTLAGVFALSSGGQGASAHPGAAGAAQAQRVDDEGAPAAAGSPDVSPTVTPTAQPSPTGNAAPGNASGSSGHLTVRVKSSGGIGGRACVTDTVSGKQCTKTVTAGQQDTLDVDIKNPDTRADLLVQADHDLQGPGVNTGEFSAPLNREQCVVFDDSGIHLPPTCDGF